MFAFPCRHYKQQGTQQRWPQESSQRCRQHGLAALPRPACCDVSNDPIIAIKSERSFLNLVLTDEQLRGHLLSEAGMQLGAQGSPLLAAACTDYASTSGAVGAIDISYDQSLSVILERLRETRPLPGGEERCLPRVGPECASQVRISNNIQTGVSERLVRSHGRDAGSAFCRKDSSGGARHTNTTAHGLLMFTWYHSVRKFERLLLLYKCY